VTKSSENKLFFFNIKKGESLKQPLTTTGLAILDLQPVMKGYDHVKSRRKLMAIPRFLEIRNLHFLVPRM
jgi:hypothetical protein